MRQFKLRPPWDDLCCATVTLRPPQKSLQAAYALPAGTVKTTCVLSGLVEHSSGITLSVTKNADGSLDLVRN